MGIDNPIGLLVDKIKGYNRRTTGIDNPIGVLELEIK